MIDLLPALPAAWSEGKFEGVCARGAFEISFEWKNSRILKAVILSKAEELCRINAKVPVQVKWNGNIIAYKKTKDGVIEFATTKGEKYLVEAL